MKIQINNLHSNPVPVEVDFDFVCKNEGIYKNGSDKFVTISNTIDNKSVTLFFSNNFICTIPNHNDWSTRKFIQIKGELQLNINE